MLEVIVKKDPSKYGSKVGKTKPFKKYGRVFWKTNKRTRELHIIPNDDNRSLRMILRIIHSRQPHYNIKYVVMQDNGDGEAPKIIRSG